MDTFLVQGWVVQRVDNAIHWINHYPVDGVVKAGLYATICQPDLIKTMTEWAKIGSIDKNLLQHNRFYKSGRFSSLRYIDKREIGLTNRRV